MIDDPESVTISDEFFTKVDYFTNPLGCLLDHRCEQVGTEVQCSLSDKARNLVTQRVIKEPSSRYIIDRKLSDSRTDGYDTYGNYESVLNIQHGGFSEVVNRHRKSTGKAAISVLDSGCGNGAALEEILELSSVDPLQTVGVTVHANTLKFKKAKKRIVQADISNFKPKTVQGVTKRFDVVVSVYGTIDYHTLNRDFSDYFFGFLHAINFTDVGGLIFTNWTRYPQSEHVTKLTQHGILEATNDFVDVACQPKTASHPAILRVLRHPTLYEIKRILRIGDDGIYDFGRDEFC